MHPIEHMSNIAKCRPLKYSQLQPGLVGPAAILPGINAKQLTLAAAMNPRCINHWPPTQRHPTVPGPTTVLASCLLPVPS